MPGDRFAPAVGIASAERMEEDMRARLFAVLLAGLCVLLCGCRFAVVESGNVRIEAPAPTQSVTLTDIP